MRRLPLPIQTLYADLLQKLSGRPAPRYGSISPKTVDGVVHLYAVEQEGPKRVQRYLGPQSHPDVVALADAIRGEAEQAKQRRKSITMLKAAGLPAPSVEVGRVLDAVARAGLFDAGLVLVGTVAYQHYPALLGCTLDAAAMMTQDADFVAATVNLRLAAEGEVTGDLLAVLRRADPSFEAAPALRRNAFPCRFTAQTGLDVELLTPVRRRSEASPVDLPGLKAGAIPLHYLEFLVEDAVPAIALHGAGVRVTLPAPARYAVHKLIVAQLRDVDRAKRGKDLAQAAALTAALDNVDPDALSDAIDDATARGPKWRAHVDAGLKAIGRG
jgi:hypothetical protein